ncbi:hypothetical protein [Bacillus subtilis]|uniref:hypothetical protein n=1 Tax=Bacillus subtilis TaxID=1423 RepID=UPI003456A00D
MDEYQWESPLIDLKGQSILKQIKRPNPPTEKEIDALMTMLMTEKAPIETITIGHGRDNVSKEIASTFADLWEIRGGIGGTGGCVLDIVDWPEEAASWLRPAKRFANGSSDAWIVTGSLLGWIQMSRRLHKETNWKPEKTFGFSSLADFRMVKYGWETTFEGMKGVLANGGSWKITRGELITYPALFN